MTARRFQFMRVGAGDYLLLSNDGQTLWRFAKYLEDGSAEIVGEFWGLWRWPDAIPKMTNRDLMLLDDWSRWIEDASGFPTRAAAVRYALDR